MAKAHSLGNWGEALAAEYLQNQGYEILGKNIRTPYGEIDLLARQGMPGSETIVYVEVKTRATRTFGHPEVSITSRKKAHMLSAMNYYQQAHPELKGDWRLDVIAIERFQKDQPASILHFENAIQGE